MAPTGRVRRRGVRQAVVAIVAVAAGATAAWGLWFTRDTPAPQHSGGTEPAPMVQVFQAERRDVAVRLHGSGTVRPRASVRVVPQVSGRLNMVHEQIGEGGLIRAGEPLLRIDAEDYELALRRSKARLARSQSSLVAARATVREAEAELEDARDEVYRLESLQESRAINERELRRARVTRDIAAAQHEAATANLEVIRAEIEEAEAAVDKAELDLRRTTITFEYDVIIDRMDVERDQHVTAGEPIGEVYRVDAVEIVVPMEQRKLRHLPTLPVATSGEVEVAAGDLPRARVDFTFAGRSGSREGRVVRVAGSVDAQSRMLDLIVRVDDPRDADGGPPLVPGAFARVTFEGPTLEGLVRVPATAVEGGSGVWVVRDERMHRVAVEVAHGDERWAYVADGLSGGEQVVSSPLTIRTEGMRVTPAPDVQLADEVGDDDASAGDAAEEDDGSTIVGVETDSDPRP